MHIYILKQRHVQLNASYYCLYTSLLPSAGVGRSGAFCAISTAAIERVKAEGSVDIFHGIKYLLTHCPHMV